MVQNAPLHVTPVPVSACDARAAACADATLVAADTSGASGSNVAAVATNRRQPPLATRPRPRSRPPPSISHAPSTQQTLIPSVSDGDAIDLSPGTSGASNQVLRPEMLSGLGLEDPRSGGVVEPPIPPWDFETDVDEEEEKGHGGPSRLRRQDSRRPSLAATAPIYGEGVPVVRRQLGPPKASVITDLGDQISTMHPIWKPSDPTTTPDFDSKGLGERLYQAMTRRGPYEGGFVPKAQLQNLVNKAAVEQQLAECDTSFRGRVRRLSLRPSMPKAKPKPDRATEAQQICGKGDQTWPVYDKRESALPDHTRHPRSEKRFLKIMAILCLIDQPSKIRAFVQEGVCDSDLPLVWVPATPKPTERSELRPRRDLGRQLKCFERWKPVAIDMFEQRQWAVLAPFFGRDLRAQMQVPHYYLPNRIVLPFSERRDHDNGGFSDVYMVKIHPEHHDFARFAAPGSDPNIFAVKELFSRDYKAFEQEVEVLRRVSRRPHPHLINLLATYEHNDRYHLLFPWAKGNLYTFWQTVHPQNDETGSKARWLVQQSRGLASGLARIHRYQRTSSDSIMNVMGLASKLEASRVQSQDPQGKGKGKDPKVLFCRHGDIKPENILWFPAAPGSEDDNLGVLIISDFGIAEFDVQDDVPRSQQKAASLVYEAPEVYLPVGDGVINTRYDVWGLGCIFLEFLAWYFGGWDEVNRFLDKKMDPDEVVGNTFDSRKFRAGMFFIIGTNPTTKAPEGWVKESVRQFILELYSQPRCTEFIHEFLALIECDMLVVEADGKRRFHSAEVEKQLERMEHKEKRLSGYFTYPAPWTERLPWNRDRTFGSR